MPGKTLSALLVLSMAGFSALIAFFSSHDLVMAAIASVGGLILGVLFLSLIRFWLTLDGFKIVGGAVGTLFGMLVSFFIISLIDPAVFLGAQAGTALRIMIVIVFSLIGMQLGATKSRDFKPKVEPLDNAPRKIVGILDTSVIIDGRIADVCETGFLDGDIVIPQFVLKELQTIADSSESTKRTRGRRGLDILNKIKKQAFVKIIIEDTDYPSVKDVDQKLIHMARDTGYAILTNDFNLNKVAEVQSIQVLNINQLANSLKPIVLPGETMKVQILKEGKEAGQGIAYLDDGTMVVVDNGRRSIGKHMDVTVTSVLQTTAGRMIFAVVKNG